MKKKMMLYIALKVVDTTLKLDIQDKNVDHENKL